jgi:hypothetical protein
MPALGASTAGATNYTHYRNNAATWWFQDAGMRKLAVAILVGFAGTINGGEHLSLLRHRKHTQVIIGA